jgi:hypothetical protein
MTVLDGTADAAISNLEPLLDPFIALVHCQGLFNVDGVAKFIHNHGNLFAMLSRKDIIEQRCLPSTKVASHQSDGHFEVAHLSGLLIPPLHVGVDEFWRRVVVHVHGWRDYGLEFELWSLVFGRVQGYYEDGLKTDMSCGWRRGDYRMRGVDATSTIVSTLEHN